MSKIKKIIKYFLFAILIATLGYYSMAVFSLRKKMFNMENEVATITNEQTGGNILGEEEGQPVQSNFYASQNFRSPQISFGGEAITVPAGEQSLTPEIFDMRSELLTTKTDQKVKFMLTWKTNKLCRSSIEYMREGQAEGKIISDDGFGFAHSVSLSPLNYSTSYSYIITAHDKWGNEMKSEKLTFYTGAPKVSIFDLLGGAFKDMFGWANKN
jgi:hypothetical protein